MLNTSKKQAAFVVCLLCFSHLQALAETRPQRVVSLNLCTDILALSLADPAQILSVSAIARDPVSSPVVDEAMHYPTNRAGLEEILSLKPDLVLASVYTLPDKLHALEKAGLRVELFDYAQNFTDIGRLIAQMGTALEQQDKAQQQLAEIAHTLAKLPKVTVPVTALLYEPNGYISGAGTLADESMRLLGLTNLATENPKLAGGKIGLEALVQLHPDLLIVPELYNKPALAYQNYSHPVMEALQNAQPRQIRQVNIPMRYWSCGSIYTLEALKILADALPEHEAQ